MYETPGDYLLTYVPGFTEEHTDSSDFEGQCIPFISKKRGNHSLLHSERDNKRTKMRPRCHETAGRYNYEHPVKLQRDHNSPLWDPNSTQKKRTVKKEHKNLNSGDQPRPVQSKLSLIRQKVIPCLSSIFRGTQTKQENKAIINESIAEDAHYTCQNCGKCERRRIKKLYKKENYAVQPVYAIEGNIHNTPNRFNAKMIEPSRVRNKSRKQYSTCSSSSTSYSDIRISEKSKMNMKKRFKTEILKEHSKYQRTQASKNQKHQQKDRDSRYQVFTNPYQQLRSNSSRSESQYATDIPASSSGFWEYLFDKINLRYQIQKMELPKPCRCSSSSNEQLKYSPSNSENLEDNVEQNYCMGQQRSPMKEHTIGNTCSCKSKQEPPSNDFMNGQAKMSGCYQNNPSCHENCPQKAPPTSQPLSLKMKPQVPESKPPKVQCKCYDKVEKKPKSPSKSQPPAAGSSKPCQEGHEAITAALSEKYNGEILCIHNPPCILINGCLNLPKQNETQQVNLWPVSEGIKTGFNYKKKSKSPPKYEQASQYHADPFIEIHQRHSPTAEYKEYKVEKNIQSICHHNPPCEVVRGCYKPKYDPRLHLSCVHVPMCQRIPECVFQDEDRNFCDHRPKCTEVPICSKNYRVLTTTGNFGSQVKPKPPRMCRHTPPCIMIPKCLSWALNEHYMNGEAIPDCNHQPSCELIPACCRKGTKEMVSVSSQYPNSCRIG